MTPLISLLIALGFAIGTVCTIFGGIFLHMLFIQNTRFQSQGMMVGITATVLIVGLTLLWLVLV